MRDRLQRLMNCNVSCFSDNNSSALSNAPYVAVMGQQTTGAGVDGEVYVIYSAHVQWLPVYGTVVTLAHVQQVPVDAMVE